MRPLLLAALRAAWVGRREILAVYDTAFAVETKSDSSPVTEADRRSQAAIRAALAEADPSIPFLGEEGAAIPFEVRRSWRRFWLVDPLDGTKEFVKRNGEFTVNIALIEDTRAVLGVVVAPLARLAYFGVPGAGAASGAFRLDDGGLLEGLPAGAGAWDGVTARAVRLPSGEPRAFTIAASRSHMTAETEAYIEECRRRFGRVEIRTSGSSLKMCRVAEGLVDVYPRLGPTSEWDVAAGQAIVEAAGGALRRAGTTEALRYNGRDLRNPPFVCVSARSRDRVPLG